MSEPRRLSRRRLLGAVVASAAAAPFVMTAPRIHASTPTSWWRGTTTGAAVSALTTLAGTSPFATSIGRWQAGDLPHAHPLPDDRVLWLLNDSFLSESPDGPIDDRSWFVRNLAMMQSGDQIAVIDGSKSYAAEGEDRYNRWWWFHGGEVDGALLHVVTTEMIRTGAPGWAINFEPRSTWITTIAWRDATILRMRPAPNSGTRPVYGFSVASDSNWTYLFGNNHLYGDGTTENRIARVRRGKLLEAPDYWNGSSWVPDADEAVSVHTYGEYACRLCVVRHDNRWLATSKAEEFHGSDAIVWSAERPTGPWREIRRRAIPTATGDDRTCTYDVMARPLPDGRLLMWWSNNAFDETLARSDPSVYRPTFTIVEV